MLKQCMTAMPKRANSQPPSGGCVLKLVIFGQSRRIQHPAAFGRLCVETRRLREWLIEQYDASRLRAAVC